MSWRAVPVELLADAALECIERYRKIDSFAPMTIIVPDWSARDALQRRFFELGGKLGITVTTLNGLISKLTVEPVKVSHERRLLRVKRHLRQLPSEHPLAPLRSRLRGAEHLVDAIDELVEANVTSLPQLTSARHFNQIKSLMEFAKAHWKTANSRARRFRDAASALASKPLKMLDPSLAGGVVFYGFYDFAPSQADFLLALIAAYRRDHGSTTGFDFLLPVSEDEYGEYAQRLSGLLQFALGERESDYGTARSVGRLNGTGGDPHCYTITASDEGTEIDGLLRMAVRFACEGIPYREQALLLPTVETYERILRDYATLFPEVPLHFTDGLSLLATGIGKTFTRILSWWREPEDHSRLELLLRSWGCTLRTDRLRKLLTDTFDRVDRTLEQRLTDLEHGLPLSDRRCLALARDLVKPRQRADIVETFIAFLQSLPGLDSETEKEARKLLISILEESNEWFEEVPDLPVDEWRKMLDTALAGSRLNPAKDNDGIRIGRIHSLRATRFKAVLVPQGGEFVAGSQTGTLIPDAVRAAWNTDEPLYSKFSRQADRESESNWLFALAVGMGDRVVISRAEYRLMDGREQPVAMTFLDFDSSLSGSDHRLIQVDLARQITLGSLEKEICTLRNMPEGVKLSSIHSNMNRAVTEWGSIPVEDSLESILPSLHSVDALGDFLECPLRGFFARALPIVILDRADMTPRLEGKILHYLLELWEGSLEHYHKADVDVAIDEALDKFGVPSADKDPLERSFYKKRIELFLRSWEKLRRDLGDTINPRVELGFRERGGPPLVIRVGDNELHFSGRIDLLEDIVDGDHRSLRIIDYKTGQNHAGKEWRNTRTALIQGPLYALGAEQKGWGTVDSIVWMHLYPGDPKTLELSGEELEQQRVRLESIVDAISSSIRKGHFFPIPASLPGMRGSACDYCAFRMVCGDRVKMIDQVDTPPPGYDQLAGVQLRQKNVPESEGGDE